MLKTLALTAALTLATAGSAEAVSLGFKFATPENARIMVGHRGKPVMVEIVGVDEDLNETEITAMPRNMIVSGGNNRPRLGYVQYGPDTYAICAKVSPVVTELGNIGPGMTYQACAALNTAMGGRRGSSTVDNLDARLRNALKGDN